MSPEDQQKQNALIQLASKYIDPISDNVIMPTMDAVQGAQRAVTNMGGEAVDAGVNFAKDAAKLPGAYYDAMKQAPQAISDMMQPSQPQDPNQQAKLAALNQLRNR